MYFVSANRICRGRMNAISLCSSIGMVIISISFIPFGFSEEANNEEHTNIHSDVLVEKISSSNLTNPVRIHSKVISGGLPENDAAFKELSDRGIKTIISVDGAKPDVEAAQKYGMRYVHLPHGYDGIPPERSLELAKAVHDLNGPIYIHCHHGKHRSPAAAAVACVGAGLINKDEAASVLAIAGTSENYRGLFQTVDQAKLIRQDVLKDLQPDFSPVAKLPAMAEAMVAIEHVFDHLKAIEKAGWKTPENQPALLPDHEALLLREHFTEFLRMKEVTQTASDLAVMSREAESLCLTLEDAVREERFDPQEATRLLSLISTNCKNCHQQFRDKPKLNK